MEKIRPIKTDDDYKWAVAEITAYFEKEPEPGSADGDRFEVLGTLIEAYEDKHYPIEAPDSAVSKNLMSDDRTPLP